MISTGFGFHFPVDLASGNAIGVAGMPAIYSRLQAVLDWNLLDDIDFTVSFCGGMDWRGCIEVVFIAPQQTAGA